MRRRLCQSATPRGPGAHRRCLLLVMPIPLCGLVYPAVPVTPGLAADRPASILEPLNGYGRMSLVPPGVGDHTHPAASQTGVRPTSPCPCLLSPRHMCLGRRSLRQDTWSRRRRARSAGVSPASAPVQSRVKFSPLSRPQPPVPQPPPRTTLAAAPSPILRRTAPTANRVRTLFTSARN
jgi:hypothetical protein